MSRRTVAISVASAALGLAVLGAFGTQAVAKSGYLDSTLAAIASITTDQSSAPKLAAREIPGLGKVLTDQNGFTLYRFDKDTANPPKSTCDGECARKWPPMLATGPVAVNGVDQGKVGTVTRTDGSKQVTVGGWAVYRFAADTAPGQATGQGVGGVWFAVTPEGGKAGQPQPGQPQAGQPQAGQPQAGQPQAGQPQPDQGQGAQGQSDQSGQQVTKLTATRIAGIGPALTDQDGRTLYLFKKDTKKPPKSNCDGQCARQWPPLLATGQVQLQGVDRKLVGTVTRSDGTKQVTVGGWPVYRFAKDTAAGQANGHGVGGVWFVIEAAGCASSAPVKPQGNAGQGGGAAGQVPSSNGSGSSGRSGY